MVRRSKRIRERLVSPVYIDDEPPSDDESLSDDDVLSDDPDVSTIRLLSYILGICNQQLADGDPDDDGIPDEHAEAAVPRKRQRVDNLSLPTPPGSDPMTLCTLIDLCRKCETETFMDCHNLERLLKPLEALDALVGLAGIKQSVVDYVLLHLQSDSIAVPEMRHIIIAGAPGCGKTTVCKIIAQVMARLDLCSSEKVVYGTQANLIGGFLGQTAPKTEALIRSAFGGVLVIDEASSLADGRSDQNSDSFSKSCLDTLNRMLSEHGDKFVCILAGYKNEIYRDILSINPGMDRRFSVRFEIGGYTPGELHEIIQRQVKARGLSMAGATLAVSWIQENITGFKHTGGACTILIDHIVKHHARRSFGRPGKNVLLQCDIDAGCATFRDTMKSDAVDLPASIRLMYT